MTPILPFSAVVFLSLAACGSGGGARDHLASSTSAPAHEKTTSCPMQIPGTSVAVEDAGNGVALAFVTTGDIAAVQRSISAMAQKHNELHGKMGELPTGEETAQPEHGSEHQHHHMSGDESVSGHPMTSHEHGDGMAITVHSRATAENTSDGARLIFLSSANEVAKLREELEMHAKHMASGSCTMAEPK